MQTKSLSAVGETFELAVDDYSGMLCLQLSGTFSAVTCVFEGRVDPAGAWVPMEGIRNVGNTAESSTGALSAAPAYVWDFSCKGFSAVRVRMTVRTSGTQNWAAKFYDGANENAPFVPAHSVTATPTTVTTTFQNSAATTNALLIKSTAGTLFGITANNTNAAARYLKLYNKVSAPVVGTDVPVLTVVIPPTSTLSLNLGAMGVRFGTGIAAAITGAIGDADATAIAAAEVKVAYAFI